MSVDALQSQFVQFYSGVSAIVLEQTQRIKTQYPILSQVDARIALTVLALISTCIAPLATGGGIAVGLFGMERYPHLLNNIKEIESVALVEIKVIAAAVAALLFYSYAGLMLPLGIGIAAGVLLASANDGLTKKTFSKAENLVRVAERENPVTQHPQSEIPVVTAKETKEGVRLQIPEVPRPPIVAMANNVVLQEIKPDGAVENPQGQPYTSIVDYAWMLNPFKD